MRSIAEERAREYQRLREERARQQTPQRGLDRDRSSITGRQPYVRFTPGSSSRVRDGGASLGGAGSLSGSGSNTGKGSLDGASSSSRPPRPALSREAAEAQSKAPVVLYTPPRPVTGVGKIPTPKPGSGSSALVGSATSSQPPAAGLSERPTTRVSTKKPGHTDGLPAFGGGGAGSSANGAPKLSFAESPSTPPAKDGSGAPSGGIGDGQSLKRPGSGQPLAAERSDVRIRQGQTGAGEDAPDDDAGLGLFGDPPPAVAETPGRRYSGGDDFDGPDDGDDHGHYYDDDDDYYEDDDWYDDHDHHHYHEHHHHHHHSYSHPWWHCSWSSLWCTNSYWDTRWYWWHRAHPSWHPHYASRWHGWRFSFGFSTRSSGWSFAANIHHGDLWYSAPHHFHWYRYRPWLGYDLRYGTCSVRYVYPHHRPLRHTTFVYNEPIYERIIYRDVFYDDYEDDWYGSFDDDWRGDGRESDWVVTYEREYAASDRNVGDEPPSAPVVALGSESLDAAWSNLSQGRNELARSQFETLVLTEPTLGSARVGYGLALGFDLRLPESASVLRTAMVETPGAFETLPMNPALTDRIRQLAEAAAEAVRLDPRDTDALFVVAVTRLLIGDHAVAYFAIDAAYRSGDVRESTLRLREHLDAVMYETF